MDTQPADVKNFPSCLKDHRNPPPPGKCSWYNQLAPMRGPVQGPVLNDVPHGAISLNIALHGTVKAQFHNKL